MSEPFWISEEIATTIHEDQIAQHGGSLGIRDENLLSASLARPLHLYVYGEPSLFDLAAAYGYGLAKNHPFIDGNKRTAFMVMYTFLAPKKESDRTNRAFKIKSITRVDW